MSLRTCAEHRLAKRQRQRPRRSTLRGFSLLEVMAAMVIFSIGAAVLFSWIGQTAARLRTVSSEQEQLFAQLAAIEFVRTLNPMAQPSGEILLGASKVVWKASQVGEESPVRTASGMAGLYVVRLYQLDLTVELDKVGASKQSLYLAGWRQVKKVGKDLPFLN
jgi:general secretion pathway protein I